MNTQTSIPKVPEQPIRARRAGERRAEDRRRSARGLLELRAKRDRKVTDRRQTDRRNARAEKGFRLAFWRR